MDSVWTREYWNHGCLFFNDNPNYFTKGAVIVEPLNPMCPEKGIIIYPEDLAASVPAVGASFSRIWYDGGFWKSVGIGNKK
jgi:hypothetical protein